MRAIDWDDAYANGKYIAGADEYPARWAAKAATFRDQLSATNRAQLDLPYADAPRTRLDLFLPDAAPRGLVVFVHGGFWRAFDKSSWSHFAQGALARQFAVAVPSYTLCPEAKIADITRQIAAAIDMASGLIAGPIHLAGHSAGGHLVTRMLCDGIPWASCFVERIARVVSISGVHDLRPLLATEMNEDFGMDAADAIAESPLLCQDVLPVPVVAWVGADERPSFIDQSNWLTQAWPNATITLAPDCHHFNVIDGLLDPHSALMDALLG
ncbi:MAG: alpha/beta hydrolase [Alphaproteobacteria bacterium]|nr:alpha/beta hydrolase [Alphaproteobacteria bacterium]